MTKAHLKTGTLLETPQSINVYSDGSWQNQKMGYVYYQGVWIPLMEYKKWIYDKGVEHVPITEGYSEGSGTFTKEHKYIYMIITSTRTDHIRTAATDQKIDITEYRKVIFTGEVRKTGGSSFSINVSLDNTKDSNYIGSVLRQGLNAENSVLEPFNIELDLTDLSGDYYIRFHTGRLTEVKLKKIWLE